LALHLGLDHHAAQIVSHRFSQGGLSFNAATVVFALLLGAFSRVYFSSTIIADDRTYGAIGAVFSLMTWLTAVGVVIILGSVAGGAWHERSSRRCGERAQETIA